ncbi:SPOR domain-containing protein [Kitasatospora sp. NPDC093806]|uniref:SPOR domain-containing protein n=1 Tax=Kitasatospora sp. NPDC093806 TaxID=3155075 RepID=UPI00342D6A16
MDTTDTFRVMRQDDNGNRFLVVGGVEREGAERIAAELEARGHKQLYWVEAEPPGASEAKGPDA